MTIKTLHITNSWHPKSGGVRTFYLALMDAANRARREMHLVVPGIEDRLEHVGSNGAIHHVKAPLEPGSDCYRLIYPLLAGDGPDRIPLQDASSRSLPGKVSFLGHQTKPELAQILANCDIFLHPNPKEPFGIGPLEAMAAGLPLVAPNTGGLRNYAHHNNSWLADATPDGFAQAIAGILADAATTATRVASARRTAEANDWARACQRFLGLYSEVFSAIHYGEVVPAFPPLFTSSKTSQG